MAQNHGSEHENHRRKHKSPIDVGGVTKNADGLFVVSGVDADGKKLTLTCGHGVTDEETALKHAHHPLVFNDFEPVEG